MRYFKRQLTRILTKAAKTFPAILVIGPRQSGKTTLLKKEFGDKAKFVSLEEPDKRLWAREDPKDFLENYSPPVIIDEFQYIPELLPYIKEKIDNNRKPRSYLLTGSQQFKVMKNVSESLAGRVAITTLPPFSFAEANSKLTDSWTKWFKNLTTGKDGILKGSLGDTIRKGFYPEIIANPKVDRQIWHSSYIQTYLERDVKSVYDIGNLESFSKFITLLAARCATLLNYATYASELGVSIPTVKKWFSILEASFIVFKLQPYYGNIGKRFIKSPKFYFTDTGLAACLAGVNSSEYLVRGTLAGQFFENFVIAEFYKNKLNFNENLNMYFINHRNLWEIDLLIEKNLEILPVEIKLSANINSAHLKNFGRIRELLNNIAPENYLVCNQPEIMKLKNTHITSWRFL